MPTIRRRRRPPTGDTFSITTVFLLLLLLSLPPLSTGIRSFPATGVTTSPAKADDYTEAPEYRNGDDCGNTVVHIAMTLDSEYLRGTVAGIHSVLRHASCPENTFFHLITTESDPTTPPELTRIIRTTFPSLTFKLHIFHQHTVTRLISSSIRVALENPLNYARNYLGEILDPTVTRVIYLDSDVIVVDDIQNLWSIRLPNNRVIGAPEYCHANFTKYFTDTFWSDPVLPRVFGSRTRAPCYFNTGVMVVDMVRWRSGGYRRRLEEWMLLQREKRIYELGSLPPFLLVFGGEVEPVDHRWNQHGLGGDNVKGSCRRLHPGPVSLLHWSGKGKPWVRLDEGRACALDYLWWPYDLYRRKERRRWLDS